MQRAAIGIRAHSGWGALVVISGGLGNLVVVCRRRVTITDPSVAGAKQPYHFAPRQDRGAAERYLADCALISERLAFEALGNVVEELRNCNYVAVGCAVLLASGRDLPALDQILSSHALMHTADGEFFRQAFWKAAERLGIPVTGIRERELDVRSAAVFGDRAVELRREVGELGASVGPPWTADQKNAAMGAVLVLAVGDG